MNYISYFIVIVIIEPQLSKSITGKYTEYQLKGSWRRQNGRRIGKPDPHLGFEVYWNTTVDTTPFPVCGYPCLDMYKSYGEICARNKFHNYKTFSDVCEMMADDCYGTEGWVMTRKGKCWPYWKTWTDTWDQWINKITMAPDVQAEYDKGELIVDGSLEKAHYNISAYYEYGKK